jgi:anti-anti-sigma factor
MKIDTTRTGGSATLDLEGRLDREWAEHLSDMLAGLLQEGVRSLNIDFSGVTYVSTPATAILAGWRQELAALRGEVRLRSLAPSVREVFAAAGWDSGLDLTRSSGALTGELRRSSWHTRADFAKNGQYELSSGTAAGALTCRMYGDPGQLARAPFRPDDCRPVDFPEGSFGLGLGAIGGSHAECHERFGELVAVAGCVGYFPTDGARMADYLVGGGGLTSRAVLASGLSCEGGFAQLMRFSTQPEAEAVTLSELAAVALETTGGKMAGLVIAGETAGLCGARLQRSPGSGAAPVRFEVPAVREWLTFAPERIYSMTTSLIVGVVARSPEGPLGGHLRPLGGTPGLQGHFHAMVFSYHPLPQRTVELPALVAGLFANHQLLDVLHLLWDDRGDIGVSESALVRGVGWLSPITQFS